MRLGRSAGASDTGRRRRRNEDAYVHQPPLFAVADGMGGAQAGEIASRLAAAVLREDEGAGGGEDRVVSLFEEANRRVYQRSSEDAAASGMGTTMTVALVADDRVSIGHVGDSRAYLIRDGRLEQLTEDHSLVAELMRTGKLSPEEAETHPQRSVITRVLGTEPDVDVDTFAIEPNEGDLFLLCSDGLTTMIDDETILGIVERHRKDLDQAARALIKAANKAGGEDNITVVFFEVLAEAVGNDDGMAALDDTQRMPMATEDRDPDEEDTLDELDRVPAVDTMVVSSDEIARRIDEQEVEPDQRRRRSLGARIVLWLLAIAFTLSLASLVLWYVVR
jgi:serine/threonine protein phosphatase PrpC